MLSNLVCKYIKRKVKKKLILSLPGLESMRVKGIKVDFNVENFKIIILKF